MNHAAMEFYDEWNQKLRQPSSPSTQSGKLSDAEKESVPQGNAGPIEAIVFDLDQTLISSTTRDPEFEAGVWNVTWRNVDQDNPEHYWKFLTRHDEVYQTYGKTKLEQFQRQGDVPFAVVSNSSANRLNWIWQLRNIQDPLYPLIADSHSTPTALDEPSKRYVASVQNYVQPGTLGRVKTYSRTPGKADNLFGIPKEPADFESASGNEKQHARYFQKPHPKGSEQARDWLRENSALAESAHIRPRLCVRSLGPRPRIQLDDAVPELGGGVPWP